MRTIVKAFSSACVGAAGVLVAGCGVVPGAAGAESTDDVENAAQALSTEGQVCITVQRGAGPASVADAVLWQIAPSWNDGANVTLSTGTSAAGGLRRSLLRFDLSTVPSNARVVSASLSLSQTYKTVDSAVRVHRVTSAWEESTVTWASFGAAFDPAAAASFVSGGGSGFRSSEITELAQAWVSGGAENHGVLIEEDPVQRTDFRSSEKAHVEDRPKLDLCYVIPDDGGAGSRVVVTSPAAGSESSYRRSVIRWEPIAGASSYHLEIDDDPSFRSPEIDALVTGTSFALDGRELALNGERSWPAYVRINGTRWNEGTFAPATLSNTGGEDALAVAPDGTVHLAIRGASGILHVSSEDWSRRTVISSPETFNPWTVDLEADPITGDVHAAWREQSWDFGHEFFYSGTLSGWQPVRIPDAYALHDIGWQGPSIAAYGGVVDIYHPSGSGLERFRTQDGHGFARSMPWSTRTTMATEAVLAPDGRTVLVAGFQDYRYDPFYGGSYAFSFGVFDEASGWEQPLATGPGVFPSVAVGPDHVIHVIVSDETSGETRYSSSLRGFARWTATPLGSPNQDTRTMAVDAAGRVYVIGQSVTYEARLFWSDDIGETWSSRELPGSALPSDIEIGRDGVVHLLWSSGRGATYANSLGAFMASDLAPEIALGAPAYTDTEVSVMVEVGDPDEDELTGEATVGFYPQATTTVTNDAAFDVLGLSVHYYGGQLHNPEMALELRTAGSDRWSEFLYLDPSQFSLPLLVEVRDRQQGTLSSFRIEAWDGYYADLQVRVFEEAARVTWTGQPTLSLPLAGVPSDVPAVLRLIATDGTNMSFREQILELTGQPTLLVAPRAPAAGE
ncbi:DNRLRE domain-containing protein [Sorangium sp. So ce1182]|uniref:DNRLRE domain-containing protein n=1 Tax=Sorangium sp. So ce1182 TaxID=3133334 RepID=UPI003F61E3C3